MNPDTFIPSPSAAVRSLQILDSECDFDAPTETVANPFIGEPMETNSLKHKTTREVLCFAASLDPIPDDVFATEQLVGSIL